MHSVFFCLDANRDMRLRFGRSLSYRIRLVGKDALSPNGFRQLNGDDFGQRSYCLYKIFFFFVGERVVVCVCVCVEAKGFSLVTNIFQPSAPSVFGCLRRCVGWKQAVRMDVCVRVVCVKRERRHTRLGGGLLLLRPAPVCVTSVWSGKSIQNTEIGIENNIESGESWWVD